VADQKMQYGNFFVKWIVMEHWWLCDVCKKCGCQQSVYVNKMKEHFKACANSSDICPSVKY